ncbi:hypothetical protein [Runella sp. SP2]|uniref:hypothetical protein n=1 Tax=Runella sp. SP2 TaxID=2268026 RepID=UPI000F078592|nr:hypothetical protein [Runella sp. SP2]AYQ31268.1 hypothetical protein DTQ70_03335 [Runella sp. SP2]
MHFKREHIIGLLKRVSEFASDNLEILSKVGIDVNDEFDSTYVGMIVRQHTITTDLKLLFSNKKSNTLTSELVLFRCLVDDFIHLTFIFNQADKNEQILNLNGDAISKNLNKLSELAIFNEEKLNGSYPYYPTRQLIEEIKEKIKKAPNRQQYIINQEDLKFRTFKSTGNLIRSLDNSDYTHSLIRAYFIWRKLSDFVHYSNFSYEEEQQLDPTKDNTYTEFAEIISYSYKTVLHSLVHFSDKYGIEIKDRHNLKTYYKDAGH